MAAYVGSVTGDYGNPATWGGSGVPGNGDTWTINSGVTVDVTDTRVFGTSPAAGNVVGTINQTSSSSWGTLIIKSGGFLTVRGDILNNGVIQIEGGGILEFDASLAASPSSQNYKITLSNGGNPGVSRFVTANTLVSNRAIVRSNAGGGNGCFTSSSSRGYVDVSYVDFLRVGTTSLQSVQIHGGGDTNQKFSLVGCTFDSCSGPLVTSYTKDFPYALQDCVTTNSLLVSTRWFDQVVPTGSASKVMTNCRFDAFVRMTPTGLSVSHCVFAAGYSVLTPFTVALWQYNVWTIPTGAGPTGPETIDKGYVADISLNFNPHSFQPNAALSPALTGVIWDHIGGTNGDLIGTGTAPGKTFTATYNIILPNSAGGSPGELFSPLGTVDAGSLTADHNTVIATSLPAVNSESGLAVYGETFTGVAGMYASLRSNYIYSPTGKGSVLLRHNQSVVADPIQASGGNLLADYNAFNAPITAIGSGVQAVYGASGGYCDTNGTTSAVRIVGGSTGSFTLLCYHSNGVTTAETAKIAYNATGATVASAVQTALNTLSDGTYAVSSDGNAANSSTGTGLTITRNASAISQARIYAILRQGGTNTTGGTVYTTREMFSDTTGLGVHDIVANPNFVDTTRNLATFDTAYLGNTASAWTNGAAYAAGDLVSTASSGFYGNATINFRCIAAHTATSGNSTLGQPGVASSWNTSWELASVYRLRASAPTYSAGVRQATARDLYEWVKAGWAPTNAALKATAHDGGDIGAVPWVSAGGFGLVSGGPLSNPLLKF